MQDSNLPLANPFVKALRQANFTLVGNEVRIANFSLPFLQKANGELSIKEPLPFEFLFPWQNSAIQNSGVPVADGRITLLHFSLHECLPCEAEISQLHQMSAQNSLPNNMQLWQVVGGTNATALIAAEMNPIIPEGAKVHLDLEEALSERLGIIGAPATWLLDESGFVVGYRNGDLNFACPGMELLFERIRQWPKIKTAHPQFKSLVQAVSDTHFALPDSPSASLLKKIPAVPLVALVLLIVGAGKALCAYRKRRAKPE